MPHLPESARLWLERAEIDYIGPFIKAWASFNSWFREASSSRRDAEGLRYVKEQPNPVRSSIKPLLAQVRTDGHGNVIPDGEPEQKFKLLIRDLHVALDSFHLEVSRDDAIEQISFRSVCLKKGVNLPKIKEHNSRKFSVNKTHGTWTSTVSLLSDPNDVRAKIEQDSFDIVALQADAAYGMLSQSQRSTLLNLYQQCNPRPMTDLFAANSGKISAGDVEFLCSEDELFCGLLEIIYSMRNALLHGELQPHEHAFAAYEPAYRIVMRFLRSLQA